MGTPYGRQSSKLWEDVRRFDKETTQKFTYTVAATIRHIFPHTGCTHESACKDCRSIISQVVTKTREEYEGYLGNKLSELVNIQCPFPHGGD